MVIFIDESGSFSNPQKKSNVISCVGALSIPETCIDELFANFEVLKKQWNISDEIKGSQLTETQASQLVDLCRRYDIVLKVIATDMGQMSNDTIKNQKRDQAAKIRASAEGAHPNMEKELHSLADRVLALSDQLYVQSVFMTLILDKVFRETTLYYCQRDAQCLGSFTWIIDAKDKVVTEYENLWSTVCMPFLQSLSVESPLIQIREGDYSAFEKFQSESNRPPEHLAPYLNSDKADQPFLSIDIKKLLSSVNFSDSKKELGLQLADLLITIVRRSLSLTMQIQGWRNIGKLMIQVQKGEYAVPMIVLGEGPSRGSTPYGKIITHYTDTARPMFR